MIGGVGRIGYGGNYGSVAAAQYMFAGATGVEEEVRKGSDGKPLVDKSGKPLPPSMDERQAKRLGKMDCEACKNRKYQDGSDEQVSFKSAAKINPAAVEAKVRGHEQEHVANAYDKAEQEGGKVLQASVRLKYAVCPECGRSYCAGGETSTMIRYPKEQKKQNPYEQNHLAMGQEAFRGNNMDAAV
ncbi:MAG: hypothetical protein IK115_04285 [Lachnospiraceae bacterium]|nr:hypothetical protein [Lachnospiraceae bacterium]